MMRIVMGMVALCTLLVACDEQDPLLPGAREEVRPGTGPGVLAVAATDVQGPTAISLPAARRLGDWPLRMSNAANNPAHATLSAAPALQWSANIGSGDSRKQRITADPVSDGTRIYTLDAQATVTATTVGGGTVWSRSLVPGWDRASDASGGGLAVVGGTVYATTGFGELHALEASTGNARWTQRLDAPVTTPKVAGDLVYVVSRDNRAWAIRADNGRIEWELPGAPAAVVTATAPAPAVTDRLVIFPYGSGEITAALRQSGIRVWGSGVSGQRRGVAYNQIGDITGDPVAAGGVVYAGTASGRMVALNTAGGTRVWTLNEGAVSPLSVVGGSVFAVTDRAQLIRVDAATGEMIWRTDLPFYRNQRLGRREGIFVHYGPVLAGGKMWVASSDGILRGFDPASGAVTASVEIPGGAASRPIAFGDALYVVGRKGQLHAFR